MAILDCGDMTMNKQERGALRDDATKLAAVTAARKEAGKTGNSGILVLVSMELVSAVSVTEQVPALLDEIERLETENAALKAQFEIAAKWIPTLDDDDGMEVYDD